MKTTKKQFNQTYECTNCGASDGHVSQQYITHKEMRLIGAKKHANDRYSNHSVIDSCTNCDDEDSFFS